MDALATRVGFLQDALQLGEAVAMDRIALLAARQAPNIPTQEKEPTTVGRKVRIIIYLSSHRAGARVYNIIRPFLGTVGQARDGRGVEVQNTLALTSFGLRCLITPRRLSVSRCHCQCGHGESKCMRKGIGQGALGGSIPPY